MRMEAPGLISYQSILCGAGVSLDSALAAVQRGDFGDASTLCDRSLILIDLVLEQHNSASSTEDRACWVSALVSAKCALVLLQTDIDEREANSRQRERTSKRRKTGTDEVEGEGSSVVTTAASVALVSSSSRSRHSLPCFADIIGSMAAKRALLENVVLPLTMPKAIRNKLLRGIRSGTGNILLYGPPGTGKTLLAQAAAQESGAAFFPVRPSDILSKWQGESENKLRSIFEAARNTGRAIIFFDEFDSIALSRGGTDDGAQARRLLSELLLLMTETKQSRQPRENLGKQERQRSSQSDEAPISRSLTSCYATPPTSITGAASGIRNVEAGVGSSDMSDEFYREALSENANEGGALEDSTSGSGVVVLAATNRINDLDDAVIRRFSSRVYVGLPDDESRHSLLLKFLEDIEHALTEEDLTELTAQTTGWSGADIEFLVREAAMAPVRRLLQGDGSSFSGSSLPPVTASHALESVTREDFAIASEHLLQVDDEG